jgi:hypothetical protein
VDGEHLEKPTNKSNTGSRKAAPVALISSNVIVRKVLPDASSILPHVINGIRCHTKPLCRYGKRKPIFEYRFHGKLFPVIA